ncbi:MAG: terminase small subunit [Pseudomonadota bacterium]|uniref:Putative terminase small subunit n=1 Tax=viral metagenome TaxID=1070528 RepID=A0A6M3J6L7_9ZZZZ
MNDYSARKGKPTTKKSRKAAKTTKTPQSAPKQPLYLPQEAAKTKHAGGRPPLFSTPEEMQTEIDAYYESCIVDKITEAIDRDGKCTMSTVRYQDKPYTIEGLTWSLGFSSRKSLLYYEEKPEFSDTIKRAKLKVKMSVVEGLLTGKNAAGNIFWLKNNDSEYYRDVQQLEHTGKDGGPIKHTDATDEELLNIATGGRARASQKTKGKSKPV